MRTVEVTSLYYTGDNYWQTTTPASGTKTYSNIDILVELFGKTCLPEEFGASDIISEPIVEYGKFKADRGGSYNTKAVFTVNLDSVVDKVNEKENKKQAVRNARTEMKKYSLPELAERLGLKEKLIRAANNEISIDEAIGEYVFMNELKVFEVTKRTYEDFITKERNPHYSLYVNTHPCLDNGDELPGGYYIPDNFSLFNDKNTKENKFNALFEIYGVITKKDYEKYIGETPKKDPNEYKRGYFQCWECGMWMPLSSRHDDGTCGC